VLREKTEYDLRKCNSTKILLNHIRNMLPDKCCIIFTLCAMNLTRQTPLTARISVITIKKHVVKAMTRPWRLRTTTILFGISAFFLLASGVYINNRPVLQHNRCSSRKINIIRYRNVHSLSFIFIFPIRK